MYISFPSSGYYVPINTGHLKYIEHPIYFNLIWTDSGMYYKNIIAKKIILIAPSQDCKFMNYFYE
jgi:hypothetical protein